MSARRSPAGPSSRAARFGATVALGLLSIVGVACGRSDAVAPPATPPDAPSAASGAVEDGTVSGAITDAAGRPVADAEVRISGNTFGNGEDTSFTTSTGDDGRYLLPVPPGIYGVSATVTRPYHGRDYRLDLHPVDGRDGARHDSRKGVTKDFVLRLSGPRVGTRAGQAEATKFYGTHVEIDNRSSYEDRYGVLEGGPPPDKEMLGRQFLWPKGATLTLTLAPDGPLIDGSPGETLTHAWTVDRDTNYAYEWSPGEWVDIPIGRYTATAEITEPDGQTRALRVAAVPEAGKGAAQAPPVGPSAVVDFEPASQDYVSGADANTVYLMR